MDNKLLNDVDCYIKSKRDEIILNLIKLASIPSVQSKAAPGAPFGENCAKALSASAKLFEEYGIKAELFKNAGYALAGIGSGKKTIGIFTHSDVVPAEGDWIYTNPFKPIVLDNCLVGRGVEDNKSGIIAALYAMRAIKEMHLGLNSKIVNFIGSNEETGMKDIKAFVDSHSMPDVSLIPDNDFPVSIGEKGILTFNIKAAKPFKTILSFDGGKAFNVSLDKVRVSFKYNKEYIDELLGLTKGKDEFTVITDNEIITLEARGIAKHAAMPEGSVNAAKLAADLLCKCSFLNEDDLKIMRSVSQIPSGYYGKGLRIEYCDRYFGRLTCVNGIVKTLQGYLNLSFDIRYGTGIDYDKMMDNIKLVLNQEGWYLANINNRPGFSISRESPYAKALLSVYREISNERQSRLYRSAGGTYARYLKNAFSVGTEAKYIERNLNMSNGHGGAHQCDESISIDGFLEAIKILTVMLIKIDKI
ncbi:MAG: Sapep family Mn(2+)-dependent dipeptidase [Bacillota bacterium]|nr:Sapep family Mn(2+)-dependent dipeptidase [Bacillota bacterium]